jgi:hypothetical protein
MGYVRQTSLPAVEPVSLVQARQFLRLPDSYTAEDALLTGFIQAAREKGEILTARGLAKRTFVMVLDSHPYYTDTIQSQQAYPPDYFSLPRYSTTLWNYSQMIKLPYSPVISAGPMLSIGPDGNTVSYYQDVDFILDRITEPSRIFPLPGNYWPADLYVANALEIPLLAGYDPDPTAIDTHTIASSSPPTDPPTPPGQQPTSTIVTGVPQMIILGILNLVSFWFNNRGSAGTVPPEIENIFLSQAIVDFQPTRG